MDPFQETAATWNKIASLYESTFMDLDLYNDTYDRFLSEIPPGSNRILEVGCGPGNVTTYVQKGNAELQIVGIDNAPNMVALARKNVPSATFHVMDALQIRQLDPGYGGIIAGFFLPYCTHEDRLEWLKDCWHLLTENGVFYLSFVPGDASDSGFKTGSSGDRTYFYYHPLNEVRNELETIGFGHVQVIIKEYLKSDGSTEEHAILLSQKVNEVV